MTDDLKLANLRAAQFEALKPDFPVEELNQALKDGLIVDSFTPLPVPIQSKEIGFLALKFALSDGSFPIVFLDRVSACFLREAIVTFDKRDWKMLDTGDKPIH